jgi:beta-phosphoglucomutase
MAVVFDCDGVLVDSEPLHYEAFQEVLRPFGLSHDYDQYLRRYIGFDDRDAFVEVFRDASRPLDTITLVRLLNEKERALQHLTAKGITTFPGAVRLVRELAANNVPLAVASGALRHEVKAFLKALGIHECFGIIVAADDVVKSKPDPETYLKAVERLGEGLQMRDITPMCCIAIEDTPTGIQSARDAGLFVIGIAHSYPGDQLRGAHYVVESLTQLDVVKMVGLVQSS